MCIGFGFIETFFEKHLLQEMGHSVNGQADTDNQVARGTSLSLSKSLENETHRDQVRHCAARDETKRHHDQLQIKKGQTN